MQMQVVITSQPEMTGNIEAEIVKAETKKMILGADVDATTDQPIPNTGD